MTIQDIYKVLKMRTDKTVFVREEIDGTAYKGIRTNPATKFGVTVFSSEDEDNILIHLSEELPEIALLKALDAINAENQRLGIEYPLYFINSTPAIAPSTVNPEELAF